MQKGKNSELSKRAQFIAKASNTVNLNPRFWKIWSRSDMQRRISLQIVLQDKQDISFLYEEGNRKIGSSEMIYVSLSIEFDGNHHQINNIRLAVNKPVSANRGPLCLFIFGAFTVIWFMSP